MTNRLLHILSIFMLFASVSARADEPDRPNVLMIAIDDLNNWCGVMGGHPQAHTPHLDRLAERGIFFDRAYCAAPACNPSRVAVLTGIRPSTSGMYVNDQKFRSLLPDAVTLPQLFAAQGYRVAGGGKIFHGGDLDPRSWTEYFPQPRDPRPVPRREGPLTAISQQWNWQPLDVPDEAMADFKTASWASDWLADDENTRAPFFLAVGFFRPHMPLEVPRSDFDAYPVESLILPTVKADDLDDVPPLGRWFANNRGYHRRITGAGEWRLAVQAYLAAIRFMDRQLGQLIDALDSSPAAAKTIIVLWSDHGWHLGEKEHWSKFALWEQSTRVPFLIVAPGMTSPGRRCAAAVSLLDLYPTLAELCRLPAPEALEGISLVPWLEDPDKPRDLPAITTHGPHNHAVRNHRWRYICYADGGEELYDHQSDPDEWTNLAGNDQYQSVIRELADWLPAVNRPLTTRTKWLPGESR